ncbi:lipopolysaccharide/colanic/teichoic acid biosynthesis glycosyltransferase [Arthrobacter pascens]|uniref:sugar transferase n=1 Tax=Arthrobacter pascens TaxID=1677 RepID=UPI00285FF837|nr:sugar transferase [Arthrobacter pascens]MDR6555736.1 lipopolysaccharide/colanic/teichoic acid biosynthesis glycosyltransferase [Arthrobacter pascens]
MDAKIQAYLSRRRVLDCIIAGGMLVILSPLLAAIAVLIRLRMGNPILFRQQRIGRFGEPFEIIKFRTMIENAEEIGGGYISTELNLVPPLGQFLRSTSLDELPQLVNIFKGEMSFVGPRPTLPQQYSRYTPEQARRVSVPQGITGLAQITYRNQATWTQRIEKDLEYVESVGFFTDVRLILRTVSKVLRSEGIVNDQTAAEVDDLGQNNRELT